MAGDGPKAQLLQLPYSPWSEKAKWALDYHRIDYDAKRYAPILGEPALRWSLRQIRGPISVPCLRVEGRWIGDSFEIARWADEHSCRDDGGRLMPASELDRVEHYNVLAERGLAAGRWGSLRRLLGNRAGLLDMVPRDLRVLGPVAVGIARVGVQRTLRKYARILPERQAETTLIEVLDSLRTDLKDSPHETDGVKHLLPRFGFADIAMSQVLAFVDPPSTHLRMSHATRDSFHDPELAPRYEDLARWRDALYVQFRGPERRR